MSHIEGPFVKINGKKPENQAFAEFKYLEKTNHMVMQTQNHNYHDRHIILLMYSLLEHQ